MHFNPTKPFKSVLHTNTVLSKAIVQLRYTAIIYSIFFLIICTKIGFRQAFDDLLWKIRSRLNIVHYFRRYYVNIIHLSQSFLEEHFEVKGIKII